MSSERRAVQVQAPASRGARLATHVGLGDVGRALRDFATYLPTQAIPAIAGFLVLPILARRLLPTDLGVLAIAQTLVSFGWTLSGSWLSQAIMRELPTDRAAGRLGRFNHTLARAVGVSAGLFFVFALALALASTLSNAIGRNALLIAAATGALIIQNTAVSLYAASLRPRSLAVIDILARIGGSLVGVALVFAGYGVHGYLIGLAAASAVVGLIGLRGAWPDARRDASDGSTLVEWLRFGLPASSAGLLLWGLLFLDRYLLTILRSAHEVGVYSVGSVIGDKAVTIPTAAFFTAAAPLLVGAYDQGGRPEVERLMREYTRVLLLITMPVVAFLVTSSGIIVPLLAGTRYYSDAAHVTPLVAAGALFYALSLMANTGLVIARRTAPLALTAGIGLAVNVVANLALIPPFGIVGAGVATVVGMLAYLLATHFASRRYATWNFPWATLRHALVASLVGGGAGVALAQLASSGVAQMALIALAGGPLYIGTLALLGEHRPQAPRASGAT